MTNKLVKGKVLEEQVDGGAGGLGVHLSPWIHQEYSFRHRSACRTPAESGQEYLTCGKEYKNHAKLSRMKELGRKTGVLVGMDKPSAGGGTEAGAQSSHQGNCLSQRVTFKAESETADLWQPKWTENQTVLATSIHIRDRDADPLEGIVAGSRSLGIVEQSQGQGCC